MRTKTYSNCDFSFSSSCLSPIRSQAFIPSSSGVHPSLGWSVSQSSHISPDRYCMAISLPATPHVASNPSGEMGTYSACLPGTSDQIFKMSVKLNRSVRTYTYFPRDFSGCSRAART